MLSMANLIYLILGMANFQGPHGACIRSMRKEDDSVLVGCLWHVVQQNSYVRVIAQWT